MRPTTLPTRSANAQTARRALSAFLWTVQVLLALLFLFAGGMKLVLPIEMMSGPVALPEWFLRFVGVAEVLGGIGLVVPSLTRIVPRLTPLAAAGLVVIMIGAVAITLIGGGGSQAVVPAVVFLLLAAIVDGRARRVPIAARLATR
jgi:uncharacterized membrane protein YphA (DoxX/SURF4 family)